MLLHLISSTASTVESPKTQLTSSNQSMIDPGFKIKGQGLYLLENNWMSLIHFLLCTIHLYPSKGV